jgi:hypothetical protein
MRTRINTAAQAPLFVEIIETVETRDEPFADGTRTVPPPGDGWHIHDFSHEKRTTWTRTRLVPSRGRP